MATAYPTADDLKDYLDVSDTIDDTKLGWAVLAAPREIEGWCGRKFTLDVSATARKFNVSGSYSIPIDDVGSLTSLAVATDDNDDGTAETAWLASDYELRPVNALTSWGEAGPYTELLALGRTFPISTRGRSILQVTAKWGWPAVPDLVFQAALVLGAEAYHMASTKFGLAGFGEFGSVKIRTNGQVESWLAPYRRAGASSLGGLA